MASALRTCCQQSIYWHHPVALVHRPAQRHGHYATHLATASSAPVATQRLNAPTMPPIAEGHSQWVLDCVCTDFLSKTLFLPLPQGTASGCGTACSRWTQRTWSPPAPTAPRGSGTCPAGRPSGCTPATTRSTTFNSPPLITCVNTPPAMTALRRSGTLQRGRTPATTRCISCNSVDTAHHHADARKLCEWATGRV